MKNLIKLILILVIAPTILMGCTKTNYDQTDNNQTEETTAKKKELKMKLTDLQYRVTQEDATEPAFKNEYWDNHEQGIYVDLVSNEPLFISTDKYDSDTGWPSFTKPIDEDSIELKIDNSLGTSRTEVRSSSSDSHLGHLFKDGPKPTNNRYCINSAALKFIPRSEMEEEGFEKYLELF